MRWFRRSRPVNNFGDVLGPVLIERLLMTRSLRPPGSSGRLLSVGSILTMAREGDVVWGSGVNGKLLHQDHVVDGVDFRAVRGPLTRDFLVHRGAIVPEVYGDPGLLVGALWPELRASVPLTLNSNVLYVPNMHDLASYADFGSQVLSPTRPLLECMRRIADSSFVIASSLHGVILAESFGVPARIVRSSAEPEFKYYDYLLGSGRSMEVEIASSAQHALELGPQPPLDWDPAPLIDVFPWELWR
ncbi:polysaccharide pyruvyl transferase family protein [Nocardioides ochotonae]|uniref:polysaccharide pyruvyl transferase family protein n=1 Tax=Nocardioides ochotonae TaxID=2685869 RepID=UPI003C7C82C8